MNIKTISEIWQILNSIVSGFNNSQICTELNISKRKLHEALSKIKKLGIEVQYHRKTDSYSTDWFRRTFSLELNEYEFFFLYATILSGETYAENFHAAQQKLKNALSFNSAVLLDLGAGDLCNKKISDLLQAKLFSFAEAVKNLRKVQFLYRSLKGDEIRTVHPYKIIHSQHSYYLWAFCEDRKAMRFFKIVRTEHLKVLFKNFKPLAFDIAEELSGAWYIRSNKFAELITVKIKFFGDAATSIKEYKLHHSQQTNLETNDQTIVSWQLTELSEFASWLCQWLGSFEVLQPKELRLLIDQKVNEYKKFN